MISHYPSILDELAIENRYIHCDAALCGGYAAFLDPPPAWDFEDGADSIAISGHKFLGSPIPCGIVLARRAHVDRIGIQWPILAASIQPSADPATVSPRWFCGMRSVRLGMRA